MRYLFFLLAPLLLAGPAISADLDTLKAFNPVHLTTATAWKGRQFLQADEKGRLFLLRADSLEVFPFSSDGALGDPRQLGTAMPIEILRAAMSADGDWLLSQGFEVRLFRGSKEEPVASPTWFVTGMGFLGSTPVISGLPALLIHQAASKSEDLPRDSPVIAQWDGDSWEPLVSGAIDEQAKQRPSWLHEEHSCRLIGTSSGKLWAALEYRPLLREYSASGQLFTEVVVGKGEATQRDEARDIATADRKEGAAMAAELGLSNPVPVFSVTGRIVTRTLAEGYDGRIYVLTLGGSGKFGSGPVLQRYDPVTQQLDELPLQMPDPLLSSMASTPDALYIASIETKLGIWRLPWEDLDKADWRSVSPVTVRSSDDLDLEGAWKEKGGSGLLRFAKDRVVAFERGNLTVRGLVKLSGNEALLRRSGFAETWKLAREKDVLRVERDGKTREYLRLPKIPAAVSLTPFTLGEPKELPTERIQAVQAELSKRETRAEKLRREPKTRVEDLRAVGADDLAFLKILTGEVGWIDVPRFGAPAAKDAAAMARRLLDIPLLLAAQPQIEKDFKTSPQSSDVFALFHDTLQVALGGKQRYGTQIDTAKSGPTVLPVENRTGLDGSRKKLGLPPMTDYLQGVSQLRYEGTPIQIASGEVVEPPAPSAPAKAEAAGAGAPGGASPPVPLLRRF